jgi:hypothetical protein
MRRRGLFALACTAILALAALLATAPPVSALPGSCPSNEAIREEQKSTYLPDCRAYEQVSPTDKNGGEINGINGSQPNKGLPEGGIVQASADGGSITYLSLIAFPSSGGEGPKGAPIASQYLSHREGAAWSTQNITAPVNSATYAPAGSGAPYKAFSSDLSLGLMLNGRPPVENPPLVPGAPARFQNFYLRDNVVGAFTEALLTTTPAEVPRVFFIELKGVTPDLRNIVVGTPSALTPEATPQERGNLYEWADGRFEPVNVLPGAVNPGETTGGGASLGMAENESHTISNDGSRVFWSQESSKSLFVRRDIGTGHPTTAQIDATQGPDPGGFGWFKTASTDGSTAYFTDKSRLTSDSTAGGFRSREDLYRFQVDSGQLTDLTVDHTDAEGARVQGVVEASEDGSNLYFIAKGSLAGANSEGNSPLAGGDNLYMWHQTGPGEGTITFIATLSGNDNGHSSFHDPVVAHDWATSTGERTSRVAANGRRLLFMSSESLTGYDNRDANTGEPDEEVYLYDAESGKLICVSCNLNGAPPIGPSGFPGATAWQTVREGGTYQSRVLSADGSRVFFDSLDALVPQDTNKAQDVYEWEQQGTGNCEEEGGCISLLSGGTSPSESAVVDASASGSDAFFITRASLVGQDTDQLRDLYDARSGGGFSYTPPPPPCSGPGCRLPAPSPPADQAPSTTSLSGPGNSVPKHRARKHHKGRKHKRAGHNRGGAE